MKRLIWNPKVNLRYSFDLAIYCKDTKIRIGVIGIPPLLKTVLIYKADQIDSLFEDLISKYFGGRLAVSKDTAFFFFLDSAFLLLESVLQWNLH